MPSKIISFLLLIFLTFIFIVLYKGLNKSNLYIPTSEIKNIPTFNAETFFEKKEVNSKIFFVPDKFYLFNIWASWCIPCRDEHELLMDLNKYDKLEIIGLNYKDNLINAEKFLNELGNPYSKIFLDKDGTKAILWGAFGVPETFIIYNNKVIKKYIGPLNMRSIAEIKDLVK
jgi:cytochrome c biogenesis protein CcmG, thiol:disulfide interchange protein DsbE